MDTENLLYLTDDPSRITESDYFALEDIAKEYPFFQLAHILVAKGAQKTITANVKLRKAAAYAPDRNLLRKLLYAGDESFNPTISIVPEQPQSIATEPIVVDKKHEEPPFSTEPTLPVLENSDLSWLDAEEPTETLAVSLLKKGQRREAIYIYERLIDKKPQRRDYYVRQVRILTDNQAYDYKPGSEVELVSDLHKGISEERNASEQTTVETVGDVLDIKILAAQNSELTALQNIDIADDKISETYALILFSKSKFFESLLVYHKLLAKYPEREDYYKLQIKEIELKIKQLQLQPTQSETTLPLIEPIVDQTEEVTADLPTESIEKPEIHPSILPTQETNLAQTMPPSEETPASFFDQILPPDEEVESYTTATASTEKAQDPTQILHSGIETEEINEAEALKAFQQGNMEDALAIYKKLALRFPDKEAYYLSQIDILRGNFKPEDQFPPSHISQELSDASANLASSALIEEVAPEAPQTPAVTLPQEQDISEVAAISLFNEGKVKEAVEIYKQLQLKFPEKSDYFAAQIDVLLS